MNDKPSVFMLRYKQKLMTLTRRWAEGKITAKTYMEELDFLNCQLEDHRKGGK